MTVPKPKAGEAVLKDAIAIDALVCLDPGVETHLDFLNKWLESGVSCCLVTVATNHSARETIGLIGKWYRDFEDRHDNLLMATSAEDIRRAKKERKLAVVMQFQNTLPFEWDLNLLSVYHRLGVRAIQLTYNQRNLVGDGCEEISDAGLSEFGYSAIAEMNRLGILIDLNHTGRRTTLEAIEASSKPCVFTHSNVNALCANARNLTDEQIQAVAAKGGVIGINGIPAFVSKNNPPTLDEMIDHIDYVVDLVGPDHVGIGSDYGTDPTPEEYKEFVRLGVWKPENYPPPPWHFPVGFDYLDRPLVAPRYPNLTKRLLERGYSQETVRKIVGENFLRVFEIVWDQ
jgi:membrane dipeptidase